MTTDPATLLRRSLCRCLACESSPRSPALTIIDGQVLCHCPECEAERLERRLLELTRQVQHLAELGRAGRAAMLLAMLAAKERARRA